MKTAITTSTRNSSSRLGSRLFVQQLRRLQPPAQHRYASTCHRRQVESLLLQRRQCQIIITSLETPTARIERFFSSSSPLSSPSKSSSSNKWNVDLDSGIISSTKSSNDNERKFQTIIGLEIHAQLDIPTKLFSPCSVPTSSTSSSYKPNTYIHPMDMGIP